MPFGTGQMAVEHRRAGAAWLGVALLALGLRGAWLGAAMFWHDEVYSRFFASGLHAADWKPRIGVNNSVIHDNPSSNGSVPGIAKTRSRPWRDPPHKAGAARDIH